jgi:hypothetical protein
MCSPTIQGRGNQWQQEQRVTYKIPTEASVCEARSQSKPERGAREAGPRGICGGGPSAKLNSEPSMVLTRS